MVELIEGVSNSENSRASLNKCTDGVFTLRSELPVRGKFVYVLDLVAFYAFPRRA